MARATVNYELVVYDELPPPLPRTGGKSILNGQLSTIEKNEQAWGKPVRIGLYSQGTAATAAKNVLQQRFGRNPAVSGWKFYTRPVPVDTSPEAEYNRGLFAVFTPAAIVEGAMEAHQAAEKLRLEELRLAREARAAEDDEDEDEDEGDEEDDEDEDG